VTSLMSTGASRFDRSFLCTQRKLISADSKVLGRQWSATDPPGPVPLRRRNLHRTLRWETKGGRDGRSRSCSLCSHADVHFDARDERHELACLGDTNTNVPLREISRGGESPAPSATTTTRAQRLPVRNFATSCDRSENVSSPKQKLLRVTESEHRLVVLHVVLR
jgi:hypothetical protein